MSDVPNGSEKSPIWVRKADPDAGFPPLLTLMTIPLGVMVQYLTCLISVWSARTYLGLDLPWWVVLGFTGMLVWRNSYVNREGDRPLFTWMVAKAIGYFALWGVLYLFAPDVPNLPGALSSWWSNGVARHAELP